MKISPQWIRDFISVADDDRQMAEKLTASGVAIEGFYNEGLDLVYEAEVTTNRVDAMNHYGIAREVSAIYDADLKPVAPKLPATQKQSNFTIQIDDAQGCAQYTARIVRDVKIAASPAHIAHRLELIDSRPINNVADATNYVLQELGQPTHAFDLDLLEGGKIIVRRAREGETLKTLDGVERKLSPEDLIIADAVKPMAIAGVMGGFDSMITERTKNILIESAWFDPASIRRTSKRLGMHTDASHRYERGADLGITSIACARVAEIVLQTAGGQLEAEIDVVGRVVERPTLSLSRTDITRILGTDIPEQEITRILRRLGFTITPGRAANGTASTAVAGPAATIGSGGTRAAIAESVIDFAVQVPTWRLDVERSIDVIEEIARIYGYDKFANTLPLFAGGVVDLPTARKQALLRSQLLALGYSESMSSTFIPLEDARAFGGEQPVQLANPLSEEASYMRTSLIPGLVNQAAYNLNRGNTDVRLFETGDVFELTGDKVEERRRISFVGTGAATSGGVHVKVQPYSFFHMKGDIEALLGQFDVKQIYYDSHTPEYFHPGRSARAIADGATIARFGQLHPEATAARKLRQEVFVAEIMLDRLFDFELREPQYKPIPRFPAVGRDFSFLLPDEVQFERIRNSVAALRIENLNSFVPVEIFRGGNIPAGKYSILLRAEFQSSERTLRDDEVALWAQQIIKALEALGGTQR
ncbi:MAG TPA: phenylalanine--tRNA ligase subunit beta [Clostridia bacterium]|nr:phenylalanine--tRNA ligase subunit beta [Clostridia bacterium]